MQLLSVTVQRGNAEMCRRSWLILSREEGLRYNAGFAVPVLMAGWDMCYTEKAPNAWHRRGTAQRGNRPK